MPGTVLQIFALVVVLAPLMAAVCAYAFKRSPRLLDGLTIFFSLLSLAASLYIAAAASNLLGTEYGRQFPLAFLSFFYLDALSIYFMLLVNLVAFVASWYTRQFLASDARHNPKHDPVQFHLFFNLFHFTMLLVPMVANLIVLWIAVELTTVCSTLLVRYRGDRPALEAAWKFIIITTTGIIFALLGTLFLANAITPETESIAKELNILGNQMNWPVLAHREVAKTLAPSYVMLSFLFVLIGYGTKAGLAPMHTWLPDGHGEAPSPVSALLSGVMLKSALYAILRFYTITNLNQGNTNFTSPTLLVSGLFSLALATPFILKHNKFKRVLAYHSLEHMGIITFGIGIGTQIALLGALLHALNHALTKALMFLIFGHIQNEYRDHSPAAPEEDQESDRIRGVLKSMPLSGVILSMGGLALVGAPPFNIFMSEFIILWAAISQIPVENAALPAWSIIAAVSLFLLTVTIIFGGLVSHISRLLLDQPPFEPIESGLVSLVRLAPFVLLLALIFLFGVFVPPWPVNFPQLLEQSVEILKNGVAPR